MPLITSSPATIRLTWVTISERTRAAIQASRIEERLNGSIVPIPNFMVRDRREKALFAVLEVLVGEERWWSREEEVENCFTTTIDERNSE